MAEQISKAFHIPHFDLDNLFWDNHKNAYGVKSPAAVRDSKLKRIVKQSSWVIEGVYVQWVTSVFQSADKIFVLNTPMDIQEARIWKRYEKRKARVIPSAQHETFEGVQALVEWNRKYNQTFLPDFIRNNKYKEKIIQVKDQTYILHYLSCIIERHK